MNKFYLSFSSFNLEWDTFSDFFFFFFCRLRIGTCKVNKYDRSGNSWAINNMYNWWLVAVMWCYCQKTSFPLDSFAECKFELYSYFLPLLLSHALVAIWKWMKSLCVTLFENEECSGSFGCFICTLNTEFKFLNNNHNDSTIVKH